MALDSENLNLEQLVLTAGLRPQLPSGFHLLRVFRRLNLDGHTGHVALGSENLNLERSDDGAFVKRCPDEEQCIQWHIGGRE